MFEDESSVYLFTHDWIWNVPYTEADCTLIGRSDLVGPHWKVAEGIAYLGLDDKDGEKGRCPDAVPVR